MRQGTRIYYNTHLNLSTDQHQHNPLHSIIDPDTFPNPLSAPHLLRTHSSHDSPVPIHADAGAGADADAGAIPTVAEEALADAAAGSAAPPSSTPKAQVSYHKPRTGTSESQKRQPRRGRRLQFLLVRLGLVMSRHLLHHHESWWWTLTRRMKSNY